VSWHHTVATRISNIGRLLALTLLLATLWNPAAHWGQAAINLVLLLDDSSSMERNFTHQIWQQVTTQAEQLPEGSYFSLIRFADRTAKEIKPVDIDHANLQETLKRSQPPRTQRIGQNQSNIAQALQETLLKLTPTQPTYIILATDGKETAGNIKHVLQSNSNLLPIFWAKPDSFSIQDDVFIQSLQLPKQATPGELIPITAEVAAISNQTVELLLQVNNKNHLRKKITITPDTPQIFQHQLALPQAGEYQIKLSIIAPNDPEPRNNQRTEIIQVSGLASLLYISKENSPIVSSLQAGGWQVESVAPADFNPVQLKKHNIIILDDIDTQALTDEAWQQINNQVENQGSGLIALGGPHSFGGGGYRNSTLEQALPVTTESQEPLPPAALLFLLDKSGSMERSSTDNELSRMTIAQRAVLDSVDLLAEGDLAGLVSFDIGPQIQIPLGQHANATNHFRRAFTFAPNGGTRLAPALSQAIALLSKQQVEQRIIVLVTDGFVEESSAFDTIIEQLHAADIDLIALSIGNPDESNLLQRLTSINQGVLLPVKKIAYLPRLMRGEVLKRRSGLQRGSIQPQIKTDLPFLLEDQIQWPTLDGYMVTKARDHAEVYLASAGGDPLLASHFYGVGRVTAIPGGLGNWAANWHRWDHWGRFLGELVEWNSSHGSNPYLHIEHHTDQDNIEIQIDAASNMIDWSNKPDITVQVLDPAGRMSKPQADLVAPGRYWTSFPAHLTGRYQITAQQGGHSTRYSFIHQPLAEYAPSIQSVTHMENALESGTLLSWHPGAIQAHLEQEKSKRPLRSLLLALALFVYLATLFLERNIPLELWRSQHARKQ